MLYVRVVLNSFFSKRPKNTLTAGPYVGLYLGISGRKQNLDKGHLRLSGHQTHFAAAAHSHVVFCFSRWSLPTFSGQLAFKRTESFANFIKTFA